jgi:hypothetical protein
MSSFFPQPPSVQANDSCALIVGDANVNTTLELDGTNLGYNVSFFSIGLRAASNEYVASPARSASFFLHARLSCPVPIMPTHSGPETVCSLLLCLSHF